MHHLSWLNRRSHCKQICVGVYYISMPYSMYQITTRCDKLMLRLFDPGEITGGVRGRRTMAAHWRALAHHIVGAASRAADYYTSKTKDERMHARRLIALRRARVVTHISAAAAVASTDTSAVARVWKCGTCAGVKSKYSHNKPNTHLMRLCACIQCELFASCVSHTHDLFFTHLIICWPPTWRPPIRPGIVPIANTQQHATPKTTAHYFHTCTRTNTFALHASMRDRFLCICVCVCLPGTPATFPVCGDTHGWISSVCVCVLSVRVMCYCVGHLPNLLCVVGSLFRPASS